MASKIKVKVQLKGDVAEVKSLMLHPMETGSRKDPDTGSIIPAHYITQLTFSNNGATVMLDSKGSVCVTTSAPTHLIIDIAGIWI